MRPRIKEDARQGLFAHSVQRGDERHGLYPSDVVQICDAISAHGNCHQRGIVLLRPDHRGESRMLYAVRTNDGSWIPVVWDSGLKVSRTILPEDALFEYRPLLQRVERAHFRPAPNPRSVAAVDPQEEEEKKSERVNESRDAANFLARSLGARADVQELTFTELGELADKLREFNIECDDVLAKRRRGIPSDAAKDLKTSKVLKRMISAHRSKHSAVERIRSVSQDENDALPVVAAMFKSGCELLRMTREMSPEIHELATGILRESLDAASSYVTLETARRSGDLE